MFIFYNVSIKWKSEFYGDRCFFHTAETATSENVDVPVANDENTTTWAESVVNEGIQSPAPLPDALEHLYNKGLRFKKVPAFFWNYDGEQPKLSKCCSVYFSVDSVCSSQQILETFDKAALISTKFARFNVGTPTVRGL